jgi:hypothetical protein
MRFFSSVVEHTAMIKGEQSARRVRQWSLVAHSHWNMNLTLGKNCNQHVLELNHSRRSWDKYVSDCLLARPDPEAHHMLLCDLVMKL